MRKPLAIVLLAAGAGSSTPAVVCPMGVLAAADAADFPASYSGHDHSIPSAHDRHGAGGPDLPCGPSMACTATATTATALAAPNAAVVGVASLRTTPLRPRDATRLADRPPPRLPV